MFAKTVSPLVFIPIQLCVKLSYAKKGLKTSTIWQNRLNTSIDGCSCGFSDISVHCRQFLIVSQGLGGV